MKILRQIATATIVLSLVAGLFFSVPDSVYAASKRSNKITVYAWNVQENSLCLNWNKIKSSYNGYAVFRNGKAIAHLNKRSTGYFDYRLGDGTLYKYQIKTYKTFLNTLNYKKCINYTKIKRSRLLYSIN